jgi:cytochrome P450
MPSIPKPDQATANHALRMMIRERSIMSALVAFHHGAGDVFRLSLPGFAPIIVAGPDANRFVLVTEKDKFVWRTEADPVAQLLGHGMLVEDGSIHDDARALANPLLHKRAIGGYLATMSTLTDTAIAEWQDDAVLDMAVEMRKITLNIVMKTLFQVDFAPEITRLWNPLLRLLRFISPGWWMVIPGAPQPGVARARALFDDYLYRIIRARRAMPQGEDLLGVLVQTPGLSDAYIRDQVMTMIVAGHDTIAALLSWAAYVLSQRADVQAQAREEVLTVLGDASPDMTTLGKLDYLGCVVDETLRLYPPAHLGNRRVVETTEFNGYTLQEGERLGYSIYLSHRHPDVWARANEFRPERFREKHEAFAFVPFGGGERTCIGMNYALYEAKVVLARLLQRLELLPVAGEVRQAMMVTLQPKTRGGGAFVRVRCR